jgi:hypothetical protein
MHHKGRRTKMNHRSEAQANGLRKVPKFKAWNEIDVLAVLH